MEQVYKYGNIIHVIAKVRNYDQLNEYIQYKIVIIKNFFPAGNVKLTLYDFNFSQTTRVTVSPLLSSLYNLKKLGY